MNRPKIEADGKTTIYHSVTGATRRHWPVDAREVVEAPGSPWKWEPAQQPEPEKVPEVVEKSPETETPKPRAASTRGKPWQATSA